VPHHVLGIIIVLNHDYLQIYQYLPVASYQHSTREILGYPRSISENQGNITATQLIMSLANPSTKVGADGIFLSLPPELRSQIYGNIFHSRGSRASECITTELLGCRCGEGLSRACKQLYLDSRRSYFYHAEFIFRNANNCEKFLEGIGHHIEHLGALDITFHMGSETDCKAMIKICELLQAARALFSLHLDMRSSSSALRPPRRYPRFPRTPLYWPTRVLTPEGYDLQLRAPRHPLAEIKALRTFTVVGHPYNDEWEEAIFKVIASIKQTGRMGHGHEQLFLNRSDMPDLSDIGRKYMYGIAIDGSDCEDIRNRLERLGVLHPAHQAGF
jgi:hypothetical protein